MTWQIDEELNRFGNDDDENADGPDAPDWHCILMTRQYGRARHLFLQFPRPGIDRPAAEEIVQRVLAGLNAGRPLDATENIGSIAA